MFDHVDLPRRVSRLSGLKEGLIRVKMKCVIKAFEYFHSRKTWINQIMVEILDNHKVGGTIRVLSTDVDKVDGSSGFCVRMERIKILALKTRISRKSEIFFCC